MARRRLVVFSFLITVFFGGLAAEAAAQPSFYLSTDRIFASREDAVLRVEGQELRGLTLRIYKIEDPLAFFTRQENPYQVKGEGERKPSARQLAGLFFNGMRGEVAEQLKQKANYTNLPVNVREGVKEFLRVQNFKPNEESGGYLTRYPLVRELTVELDTPQHTWGYHLITLPIFEKGVYLVEGMKGKEAGYAVVMLSDLALVSRHASDRAVYFASGRQSGKGESAKLTLFRPMSWDRLAVSANKDGFAQHENRAWLDGRVYVYAEGESGVCLHDVTFYPSSSFGVPSTKAYIYTDRPLYTPGQKMFFRAVLREYNAGYMQARFTRESVMPVELYSPSGKLISKTEGRAGEFSTVSGEWAIPEDAEMGIWRLVVVHGGKRYESPFKIEQYVKPPFEVTVTTEKSIYAFEEEVRGKISARYFYGEAVRDAGVQYIVYRSERVQTWDAGVPFGWYVQDNEYKSVREERVYEGRGETDGEGVFAFRFKANLKNLGSEAYSYRVEARITDRARRLVRGSGSFAMAPGDFWLRLDAPKEYFTPGEKASFKVSAFTYSGEAAKTEYLARITYFRWDASDLTHPAEKVVSFEKRFTLPKENEFTFTFKDAGHYQIELSAKDASGNAVTTSQFVWVAGNANTFVVEESGLRIVADKKLYATGETAELLAISPVPGMQMLYTIEGDTILESGVLSLEGNSHVRKQRITERMAPNAWYVLHAVYNDRIYTVRHQLLIPPKEKFLDINISGIKEHYKPGERVSGTIEVKDFAGRGIRSSLSLAVVDRAIFALQPRMVIDIERFFYHAHRNTVIGASSFYTRFYGYAEEDKLALAAHLRQDTLLADLSKGGQRNFDESRRGNFKDLAFWNAGIATDANGKGNFNFVLPDNITAWDIDCIAVDAGDRVGSAQSSFITRKDLFVRSILPAALFENDTAVVSATVHNLFAAQAEVKVRLSVKNGEVLSRAEQTVTVPAQGEHLITWRVRAGKTGKLETELSVEGRSKDASAKDTEMQVVDVLPFVQKQFQNHAGRLAAAGKAVTREFTLPAGASFDGLGEDAGLKVRVSPSLIHLIEDSLRYLVAYPYGCVEQTLSRFVPNLLVQRLMDDYPFREPYLREVLPDMARAGLERLEGMQNSDGTWGWFANDAPDVFMTSYAVYSLALARRMGYWEETRAMLEKGEGALRAILREQGGLDPAMRAFALFALRHLDAEIDTMLRTALADTPGTDTLARALLANAMIDTGMDNHVFIIAEDLLRNRKLDPDPSGNKHARIVRSWMDDDNFIDALLLRALAAKGGTSDRTRELCLGLVNGLLARREGVSWNSTLDTAFVLTAFLDYVRAYPAQTPGSMTEVRVNGIVLELSRDGLGFEAHAGAGDKGLRTGKNVLEVRGDAEAYFNANLRYVSRQESFQAQDSSEISITRSYHRIDQASGGKYAIREELKDELPQGQLILVRLKIKSARAFEYLMIEDPYIFGAEFVSERDDNFVQGVRLNAWLSHQRERDSVVFFQRSLAAGETYIHYLIRPFLEGEYRVLPATVGSMYFPAGAAGKSDRIRIVKRT